MQTTTWAIQQLRGAPAVEAWRALADGRCSLVDRFDGDGRRFLVVVENPPAERGRLALSRRERRAAQYARRGVPNKVIAYELGISEALVSMTLRAVMTKLGARSRVDLVRLLASLSCEDDV